LLSLFRTNQIFLNVLLIPYIFIVRGVISIWNPPSMTTHGIFSYELMSRIGDYQGTTPFIACFLVFFHAILINILVYNHKMTDEQSLLPGLLYVAVTACVPSFLGLTTALIANTFLIFALHELFLAYKKPSAATNIFNVGFWISLASLFHFSSYTYVVWAIIALNVLRSGNFRENIMIIIGFLLPYLLVATAYFITDSYDIFWQQHFTKNFNFNNIVVERDYTTLSILIFFGALIVVVLFSQGFYASKKSIQIQRYQSVLYWLLLLTGASVFFQSNATLENLLLLVPAISIFLSYQLLKMPRQWAEVAHFILLVGILFCQYKSYLGF
jgi:Family of unknown function (DUF6427)